MFKLLLFFTFMCLLALCWSKSIELEDKPGYCSYRGIYIKEGESSPSPLGSCSVITCEHANPPAISALACALSQPGPECIIGEYNYTKLYPDCCPRTIC